MRVHPRGRGEAKSTSIGWSPCEGPSPRTRGSLAVPGPHVLGPGSIPADAGKPGTWSRRGASRRVHPRGRGEAAWTLQRATPARGPSPRTRGSLIVLSGLHAPHGSIPADAGKPVSGSWARRGTRVHPRGRGEAADAGSPVEVVTGPSPRTRGSRARRGGARGRYGSIPADAGKPSGASASCAARWVHPRGRGEALAAAAAVRADAGPSPRTRGSHVLRGWRLQGHGSIPADAGKPLVRCTRCWRRTVHPRGRGEACRRWAGRRPVRGPSPRTRGSHANHLPRSPRFGSIPADAGKPAGRRSP